MIKILAIGNSFSQDATHYLQQIAAADGIQMKVANLYIGGCSLQRHWENICSNSKDYLLEINGKSTENYVSVKEALGLENWDYIVTQQASHDSGIAETYEPFLTNMCKYIRDARPDAKLMLHMTWAYESDSMHGGFANYNYNQQKMYDMLSACYYDSALKHSMILIPCGDIIQKLRKEAPFIYEQGGMSICRDGFHMNVIYGRYLLAAVWYKTITGNNICNNTYVPSTELAPGAGCNINILNVVKKVVDGCDVAMVSGLHHVCLKCSNSAEYEKVLSFYRDLLGLRVVRTWETGIMFDLNNSVLEVFTNGVENHAEGAIRHFALATKDVDACINAVVKAGYEVVKEPTDIVIMSEPRLPARMAFCVGPLGEVIEFFDEKGC